MSENKTITMEELNEMVSKRIEFFKEAKKAIAEKDSQNIEGSLIETEKIEGRLRAYEEICLMINGLYSCNCCSGKKSFCDKYERNEVCALFDFSIDAMAEAM